MNLYTVESLRDKKKLKIKKLNTFYFMSFKLKNFERRKSTQNYVYLKSAVNTSSLENKHKTV